jgi:hypothetical protein
VFTLRFSDEETLRKLEQTAAALGVSTTELAEAAIERELTLVGSDQEHRLARALDRLRSAGPTDLDQDIQNFARGELEAEDPLRAYRVELPDQAQAEASDEGESLPAEEVEVRHYAGLLRQAIRAVGSSVAEVERRLGVEPKSLRRALGGEVDLTVEHVLSVLRVIGMSHEEFFKSPPAAER